MICCPPIQTPTRRIQPGHLPLSPPVCGTSHTGMDSIRASGRRAYGSYRPEFDTCRIHGWDFPRENKGIRRGPEGAVYLGAQASCRMGGGLGMFRDFKRLSASGEGSVTCQTVPFGLDN